MGITIFFSYCFPALGQTLGAGGFGSVSMAEIHRESGEDLNIPAVVAVKSAKVSQAKSLSKEKELLEKFQSCPCILHCFGDQFTTENGQHLYNILLEYAPGSCLSDLIHAAAARGLPETVVSRHAKALATALTYIHKLGYVHCDVKPQNVLLVGDYSKLADFGSCKRIREIEGGGDNEGFRETVMYEAPKSIEREEYSPESNVWGLGCTVLHMLTGKASWMFGKEAAAKDVMMMIGCSKEIPAIPIGKKILEEAKDFMRKCFVKDLTARWKAASMLDHPFLKVGGHRHHHHHHHHFHLHFLWRLQSLLPQCFHATAVHAC